MHAGMRRSWSGDHSRCFCLCPGRLRRHGGSAGMHQPHSVSVACDLPAAYFGHGGRALYRSAASQGRGGEGKPSEGKPPAALWRIFPGSDVKVKQHALEVFITPAAVNISRATFECHIAAPEWPQISAEGGLPAAQFQHIWGDLLGCKSRRKALQSAFRRQRLSRSSGRLPAQQLFFGNDCAIRACGAGAGQLPVKGFVSI